MNYALVKHLILKDWFFQRPIVIGSLVLGAVSLGLIAVPGTAWFAAGGVLLMTVILVLGSILVSATTIAERTGKTLPFVMGLPISMREYTLAKILGNLLIFLVPWTALVVATTAIILLQPSLPDGFLSFALITLVELLVNFCLLLTVGLVSESQGWATTTIVAGNLLLQGFFYGVGGLPGIRETTTNPTLVWNTTFSLVLLVELLVMAGLIALTFYLQSKKTDLL